VRFAALKGKPDLWVHPLAAATQGLNGLQMAEIALMKEAGAIGVATGRKWISDSGVMLRIMQYCAALNLPVILHCEDSGVAGHAVATAGETATLLGLSSAPIVAETLAIARDLMLAEESGAHVHFRQVTTTRGLDLVRAAKAKGVTLSSTLTLLSLGRAFIGPPFFMPASGESPPVQPQSPPIILQAAAQFLHSDNHRGAAVFQLPMLRAGKALLRIQAPASADSVRSHLPRPRR
jgi:dihydroorotase